MSDQITAKLNLPLLQPAQAQKHVTVNDALVRLDALTNMVLRGRFQRLPPATAVEGDCWAVPDGAGDAWAGQDGKIAIAANGGWAFAPATPGMRAFIADEGTTALYTSGGWVTGALAFGSSGSGLITGMFQEVVNITAGASVQTTQLIPQAALVIGATARVKTAITGTLTSWKFGTAGALDRFGSNLGRAAGYWARGMLSQPMTSRSSAPLVMSAVGGNFAAGKITVAVHWLELAVPD